MSTSFLRINYLRVLLVISPFLSNAQDGSLDFSFGSGGITVCPIANSNASGNSVLLQNDGKIVVAGTSNVRFALLRFKVDGSPDSSFGNTGKVLTTIGPGNAVCNAAAVQPDGKIVLAGYNGIYPNYDIVLCRYHTNGLLDTSFHSDGILIQDIGNAPIICNAMAMQNDGKILVAGSYTNGSNSDILLIRYHSNGSPDSSFNNTGVVITAVGNANDIGRSIAVQKDGKIIVTGFSYMNTSFDYEFSIVRYNTDGSLDKMFSDDGMLTTNIVNENDYGESLIIQEDGRIVVGGYNFEGHACLIRCNPNGTLDASFGSGGKVAIPFACSYSNKYAIALQKDHKILFTGYSTYGTSDADFSLIRLLPDGLPDPAFGNSGIVQTKIGNAHDISTSIAIQSNDKIIVAGKRFNGSNFDITLARYNNNITTTLKEDEVSTIGVDIFPNPFRFSTTFTFDRFLNNTLINIYNAQGQKIKELNNITGYSANFDRGNLSSGSYFVEIIESGSLKFYKKIVIVD